MSSKLFIAWQDEARCWHTIGQIYRVDDAYEFVFTRGAKPLSDIIQRLFHMEVGYRYRFTNLLPVFRNRLLSPNRADYSRVARWLDVSNPADEFELLAKFGRIPGSDSLLLYPEPNMLGGRYSVSFFVHGLRHMHADASKVLASMQEGARLLPMLDVQNEVSPETAVALRPHSGNVLLGYVPAFYASAVAAMLRERSICEGARVAVLQYNKDAPAQIRAFCEFSATVPEWFRVEEDSDKLPLVNPPTVKPLETTDLRLKSGRERSVF